MRLLHPRSRYFLSLILSACLAASGQDAPRPKLRPFRLAQDTGAAGFDQALKKLKTTARLLQTTAHPDDEDGGMLTYESRGMGVETMLLTLTRGDGGQNKTGSNLFDELGVLRSLELLESGRYYGVRQRFTRVADFGFSKSPQEAFQKWGRETVLADMVRVIRQFRPDVVASGWSGTPADGHGHHQAAGILTPEAVNAAADPRKFPEQIKEGLLLPWQVKKFYHRMRGDYDLRMDAGKVDPNLGASYIQFGIEGYSHQASQNAEYFTVPAGPSWRLYRRISSTVPVKDKEDDFFEGLDTTLPGLASRLGEESGKLPGLRAQLTEIENDIEEASRAKKAQPLLHGWELLRQVIQTIERSGLSAAAKLDLLTSLRTKDRQFQEATRLALDLDGTAVRSDNGARIVPGESFTLAVRLDNHGTEPVKLERVSFNLPSSWKQAESAGEKSESEKRYRVTVPENAALTKPYWHRNDPERDSLHQITEPEYQTLPLPPSPVRITIHYSVNGQQGILDVTGSAADEKRTPLAVLPAYSALFEHASQLIPQGRGASVPADVIVRGNVPGEATVRVEAPPGWNVTPASQRLNFQQAGEEKKISFQVTPAAGQEGRVELLAVVASRGKEYSEGYSTVTREDLTTFYYFQSSVQRVSVARVALPQKLKVGYATGAGDDIYSALQQLGMDVALITPEDLASGDLSRYDTIVLGIRAYDTRDDVRKNNGRLLEYVKNGGTLIVQNNFSANDFNTGKYTPYPATLSRERVSDEQSPVEILAQEDPVFHFPNKITATDFDGWVQERGVNFMSSFDAQYKSLLAANDPSESPQKGGMLRATYGKGTYIYTGFAFFRQLPAGVPGAIRLYVNLLSAGHEPR
ncbi:MAG: PIG-L family deacetylase [Acidobacteriales bacterium]|nr:PIG-L family deacetylase [Terriglobales bacterium]